MLLEELDELSLDTPDAPEVLGNFMARAVADDCVPPAYIVNVTDVQDPKALYVACCTVCPSQLVCTQLAELEHVALLVIAKFLQTRSTAIVSSWFPPPPAHTCSSALKRAQLLLNIKHGMARLDNVWGVGGGQRPVMFLISKVKKNLDVSLVHLSLAYTSGVYTVLVVCFGPCYGCYAAV